MKKMCFCLLSAVLFSSVAMAEVESRVSPSDKIVIYAHWYSPASYEIIKLSDTLVLIDLDKGVTLNVAPSKDVVGGSIFDQPSVFAYFCKTRKDLLGDLYFNFENGTYTCGQDSITFEEDNDDYGVAGCS